MNRTRFALLALAVLLCAGAASAQPISEDFAVVPTPGWQAINNATPPEARRCSRGNTIVFPSHMGAPTAYAGMNFNAATGANTCSTWYITPSRVGIQNGDTWSFWTRTQTGSGFPDRLEFRLSTNGATCNPGVGPTSVGDFTTLLQSVNPTLVVGGYPGIFTRSSRARCPESPLRPPGAWPSATS